MLIMFLITIYMIGFGASDCYSFKGEDKLTASLQRGKAENKNTTGGLAYTAAEFSVLERAYIDLFKENEDCPPCEVMKVSVDLEYNPYDVIKLIYSLGKDVRLDQLCMCAVEQGINKAIIANAAVDAQTLDKPKFQRDEITQSQCLRGEEGLAYTEAEGPIPKIDPPPTPNPISASQPK